MLVQTLKQGTKFKGKELNGRQARFLRKLYRGDIRVKGPRETEEYKGRKKKIRICDVCGKKKNVKKMRENVRRGLSVCKQHHRLGF